MGRLLRLEACLAWGGPSHAVMAGAGGGGPSLLHQGARGTHLAAGMRLSPSACVLST